MKRIGIVTITYNPNYGNVLQNIALQQVLRELGCEPETIINLSGSSMFRRRPIHLRKLLSIVFNIDKAGMEERRRKVFYRFCKQNIVYSPVTYCDSVFSGDILSEYDYYIAGSDQIWNPTFSFATDFEFLSFAPLEKRITYAVSMGISSLDSLSEEKKNAVIAKVSNFKSISVREAKAKEIIEHLTPVKATIHVDPVFLLSAEQWRNKAIKPDKRIPQRYILVYMLGDIVKEYSKAIDDLARRNNAVVINVLDGKWQFINPYEFIWLLDNSSVICTDSFHAVAFSIILHKKFFIFNRKDGHANQNSRFETLLSTVKISENQAWFSGGLQNAEEIHWKYVDDLIIHKKAESIEYLKKSIY